MVPYVTWNDRMRVAVILSGRFTEIGEHLAGHFYGMHRFNQQYNVDYYCFVWPQSADMADYIERLYRPRRLCILPEPTVPSEVTSAIGALPDERRQFGASMLPMLMGTQMAFAAFEDYVGTAEKNYDLIVRMRYDLTFRTPIPLIAAAYALNGIVSVPNCYNYHGVNDQIAVATPANARIYANAVNSLKTLCDAQAMINPEVVLEHHLAINGIETYHFPVDYRIARHWQLHLPFDAQAVHPEEGFARSRRNGISETRRRDISG